MGKIKVRKDVLFLKYQEFKILIHLQHHLRDIFRPTAGFLI
jgi:hypothetical protein